MRRISYWILSTISALVLLVGFDASRHGGTISATPPSSIVSSPSISSPTGGSSTRGSSTGGSSTGGSSTGGSGKARSSTNMGSTSRTVTGSVVQTQWGPVQVQLVVSGGSITQVKVLQYPSGNPRDVQIADYALPILVRETQQSQSAAIDMVSGATYTSEGYIQSLQSALDQANL